VKKFDFLNLGRVGKAQRAHLLQQAGECTVKKSDFLNLGRVGKAQRAHLPPLNERSHEKI
jgi:hypothetical protein